jgi:hypothetical protein
VAFLVMFGGMAVRSQQVFPVPYQWRRVTAAVGTAVALCVLGRALDVPLPVAVLLVLAYPVALAPLGFFEEAERRRLVATRARLRRAVPRRARGPEQRAGTPSAAAVGPSAPRCSLRIV